MICPKCCLDVPLEGWSRNASRNSGYQSYCKSCTKEFQSVYYERNKTRWKEDRKNSYRKLVEWYHELKESSPCGSCNEHYPYYVMEYHHVGDKNHEVSWLVKNHYGRDKILAEIEACELLCCLCHRLKTHSPVV